MKSKYLWLFFLLFLFSRTVLATVYEVGPEKGYENIGDVPWENLAAGDQVQIFWRPEPYKEKWVIAVEGSRDNPFVVQGVPKDDGQLPVIDGRDATTRSAINFWNEARGVVKIGGANIPAVDEPSWIVLENLEIRSGRPPYRFTGRYGDTDYSSNAAAVYVETGSHLIIRNCILQDSGNGLFVSHATRDILIQGCRIYDNGIEGSIYQHNTYTAAIGIIYQYNYMGPLRADCLGNNLKDRSAGLVVRCNWIEGGNRQLDLVDAEDSMDLVNDPGYHKTLAYGNILVETPDSGNSQIVHYGGDSGNESIYRKGTLHFYNNTMVSTRPDNTTVLRLSTNDEACDFRNNIVWTIASGSRLALLNQAGVLNMRNNWLKSGWVSSHSGLTGTLIDNGGNIDGDTPGFVSAGVQNYHLDKASPCIDAGAPLHEDAIQITSQYVEQSRSGIRYADGFPDIGAFELAKRRPILPFLWLLF